MKFNYEIIEDNVEFKRGSFVLIDNSGIRQIVSTPNGKYALVDVGCGTISSIEYPSVKELINDLGVHRFKRLEQVQDAKFKIVN